MLVAWRRLATLEEERWDRSSLLPIFENSFGVTPSCIDAVTWRAEWSRLGVAEEPRTPLQLRFLDLDRDCLRLPDRDVCLLRVMSLISCSFFVD